MNTQQPRTTVSRATFTSQERRALLALRKRYHEEHDLFAASEMDRLRFVRWLVRSGRLIP
jgi:hypothetical protein